MATPLVHLQPNSTLTRTLRMACIQLRFSQGGAPALFGVTTLLPQNYQSEAGH